MKFKKLIVMFLTLSLLITSGCWDKVELNERAFISGLLIDMNKESKQGEEQNKNTPFDEEKPNKLKITFGVLNPSKLQGGEKAFIEESVEAVNVPDAMDKLGQIISRRPFYGQARSVIFTIDVLKDEGVFREALDEFERKAVLDRTMNCVALEGSEKDLVTTDSKLEPYIGAYLGGIIRNASATSNTINMNLNDVLVASRSGEGTFVMPVVRIKNKENNDITVDKLALIKDYKLQEILDQKYMESFKLITGKMKNGRKVVYYKGISVPFYIFIANRKIWFEGDANNLKYRIKITLEGDIEQFERGKTIFDPKTISEVKTAIQDSMEKEITETIKHFQDNLGVDYLGIGDYTNKYKHKVYEKYKDNWNEAFKNAEFDIEVKADIRRIGVVKD